MPVHIYVATDLSAPPSPLTWRTVLMAGAGMGLAAAAAAAVYCLAYCQ